jgi:hypothetical protein
MLSCHLMDELLALPLGDQDRWFVLHGSLQKRVAHLPWGCTWQHVGPVVVRAEREAVDCTFAIMLQARLDGPPMDQLTLPSGLSLTHTGPKEGDTAYLSTVATNQLAMCNGPTEFRLFDGLINAQLHLQWEALHDKADNLWGPESRVVSQDSMGTIVEAQRVSHPSSWGYLILGSGGQLSGCCGIARGTLCSAC